jgi:hypothetical protein
MPGVLAPWWHARERVVRGRAGAGGAPREACFEGLAQIGQLNDEQRTDFFLRHDTYWV